MNRAQRTLFRTVTKVGVWLYRVSNGRLANRGAGGTPLVLLTVAGRKTGRPHTVPVAYFPRGEGWTVVGSAGGSPSEPQWFRNLRATDHARVQLGATHYDVAVRVLEGEERDQAFEAVVAVAPGFAGYEEKSQGRQMPVALLTPQPVGA